MGNDRSEIEQRFFVFIIYIHRNQIKGRAEGKLDVSGGADVGLKAALHKLSTECSNVSDISIRYYATDVPNQLPTTIDELMSLIENFPSRLESINDGKGVPMQVGFPHIDRVY